MSSVVDISSCGSNYRLFKETFGYSSYFSILPSYQNFGSFRTRNHKLLIEIGRWNGVPFNERVFHLCQKDIGDECHYILSCEYFQRERLNYIKPYYRRHPNTLRFKQLMNSTNSIKLKKSC